MAGTTKEDTGGEGAGPRSSSTGAPGGGVGVGDMITGEEETRAFLGATGGDGGGDEGGGGGGDGDGDGEEESDGEADLDSCI